MSDDSTFDATKNYKRVCYKEDRDLLNTELNEMQDAGAYDRTMILDRILAPGTILSDLHASANGSNVTIEDGVIYIDGCAVGVPGSVLSFADPGEHTIYVDVFRRDVTASDDPALVNPLTGEATAEREKWIATLQSRDTSGDPLPQGAKSRSVAPVYIFNRDTGEIRPAAGVAGDGGSLFPELAAELAAHKTSGDHDGRYYTKALSDGRFAPIGHVGAGGTAQHPAATGSTAGFMSAGDKTQLGNHETRITSVENTLPNKANNSDVAAVSNALNNHKTSSDHDTRYYTKSQMDTTLATKADDSDVTAVSDALNTHKSSSDHDSRYYTKAQSNEQFAPESHVGSGGTSQHPAASGNAAGFMSTSDKTHLDSLYAEIIAARTSDTRGVFDSLDERLENVELMAMSSATCVVAASDSIRKESANYVCDGTADEVEINQALNALPAAGGKVLLLAGTYTLAGGVLMPLSAVLAGEGNGTVVKLRNGHNANVSLIKNKDYAHKTCIRDLSIDGNKEGQTSGNVIGIEWAGESLANLTAYHRMHNVGITNTNLGVFLQFTHSCSIFQNMLSGSGGILITRVSTNASVIGNTINYVAVGSGDGVVIQSEDSTLVKVNGTLVVGNQMQNCQRGVHIGEGTQMCVVESNAISSCHIGISIASASNETLRLATGHLISGNSVIAPQTTAIEMTGVGVYSASVVGNQLVGSWQAGGGAGRGAIELDDTEYVMIQTNVIRKSAGGADYGILVKSGTIRSFVTNNDLREAGALSGLSDAGTETQITPGNQV